METTQPQEAQRTASPKDSPLRQHPIVPAVPSSSPMVTQTIFLNHPSARLSSSPASSPRIIEPSPTRRGSVHPVMSETMERGLVPGADFFDDGSSDSEWEDSEGDITQTFTLDEGLGLRSLPHAVEEKSGSVHRGRSKQRSTIASLPHFSGPSSVDDPGLGIRYDETNDEHTDSKGSKRARQMSLRRLNMDNVRVVQTRSRVGTPRDSLRSAGSDAPSPANTNNPFPQFTQFQHHEDAPQHSSTSKGRHRRNTSESMIAESIINAHVMTMRALESLNSPIGSISLPINQQHHAFPHSGSTTHPKSLSTSRHITLSPLSTAHHPQDRDRPPHLPAHFIKTPYPFSAKKEFPKPKSRPRRRGLSDSFKGWSEEEYKRLDSAYGGEAEKEDEKERYDDAKGKYVLGLVDGSAAADVDMRSRMQRNESAQGVIRSPVGSVSEGDEDGVVWVGVSRETWWRGARAGSGKLVKIVIPQNFTLKITYRSHGFGPGDSNEKDRKPSRWIHRIGNRKQAAQIDFDDAFFAHELRKSYFTLSGSFISRTFSASTLSHIRLSQYALWSGTTATTPPTHHPLQGLLATSQGHALAHNEATPFNEEALLVLFRKPMSGFRRYSWVSWARKLSSSSSSSSCVTSDAPQRVCGCCTCQHRSTQTLQTTIPTIEFVATPSVQRILGVLALVICMTIAATLLWVFLGPPGGGGDEQDERRRRVGSGVAVGVLGVLVQGAALGAWVMFS